jgi:hypothetical protein
LYTFCYKDRERLKSDKSSKKIRHKKDELCSAYQQITGISDSFFLLKESSGKEVSMMHDF